MNLKANIFKLVAILSTILHTKCSEAIVKCVLPLKPNYSFFAPLIFTPNGTLIETENVSENHEDITLDPGQEVILSCAPNYFKHFSSEKTLTGKCKEDITLMVDDAEKDFTSDLSCGVRSIEEIITPVNGCPTSSRSIEYGYTNPIKGKSYVLGEACVNVKTGRMYFVHTRLRKDGSNTDIEKLALKTGGPNYFHQEHPTTYYKVELMKALRLDDLNQMYKSVFGAKNIPMIGSKRYISDGMLIYKQYLPVTKLAWNYAIVNDEESLENFDLLQDDIMELETPDLEIYTGSSGTLVWKTQSGDQVDVYLKTNKFPVPKYLWTVVKSGQKAIAFAVFNKNNISDRDLQKDSFCSSKCEEITWIRNLKTEKQYKRVENGYVLCCELNEFRRTVTEMPNLSGTYQLFT